MKLICVISLIGIIGCANCPRQSDISGKSVTKRCSKLNEIGFKLSQAKISLNENPDNITLQDEVAQLELNKRQLESSCDLARRKYHRDVEKSHSFACALKNIGRE